MTNCSSKTNSSPSSPSSPSSSKLTTRKQRADKAIKPRPGIPLDKHEVLRLICEHRGNLSRVADAMGTTRGCVRRKCQRDDELTEALTQARERVVDELEESAFDRAIKNKDCTMHIFLLKTQGRHRGYDQSEDRNAAKTIASAAFEYIVERNKSQDADTINLNSVSNQQ